MTSAFKEAYLQHIKCMVLTICRMAFMKLMSHVQENEVFLAGDCIRRNLDKSCGCFLQFACMDGAV